jgi:hypothetical protein
VGSFEAGEKSSYIQKKNRNIKNVSDVTRQFPIRIKTFLGLEMLKVKECTRISSVSQESKEAIEDRKYCCKKRNI